MREVNRDLLKSLLNAHKGYRRLVSEKSGVSYSSLDKLANGRYGANISEGTARDLSKALDVDVEILFPLKKENL